MNHSTKFMLMMLMSFTMMTARAQEKTFESTSLEVINKEWSTKTIDNVVNGSLGIMLERFDQTWPTWMIGAVRNTMEKGLDKEVLEEETELTVIVDAKHGFASVGDDGPVQHTFIWDGMKPVYSKTEPLNLDDDK